MAKFQAQPRTPAQQILDRMKELEARAAEFKAEVAAADNDYLKYAAAKKQSGGWPSGAPRARSGCGWS